MKAGRHQGTLAAEVAGYQITQKIYNSVNFMRALTLPKEGEQQSLTRLWESWSRSNQIN